MIGVDGRLVIEDGQIATVGESHSAEVFDLLGKRVSRGNVGHLPKGIYVVIDGKSTKVSIR